MVNVNKLYISVKLFHHRTCIIVTLDLLLLQLRSNKAILYFEGVQTDVCQMVIYMLKSLMS